MIGCAVLVGGSYARTELAKRVPAPAAATAVMPANQAAEVWDDIPPEAEEHERYFPFLPGEDPNASISVGDTSHGYLVGGAELIENEAVGILPEQRKRELSFGTRPLIEMVQVAGQAPDLVPLNGQGLSSTHDLKLDPKRTWIMIKALLGYPKAQVQYLFIADGLKTQVLTYASQSGESSDLITRAAAVMLQPHGSAPHNDHLHLRIFCGEDDVLGGCTNTGGVHPWTDLFTAKRSRFVKKTAKLLDSSTPAQRKRAIERLSLLDARESADKIADMLASDDNQSDVREAAARSLARLGGPVQVPALTKHYAREKSPSVRIAITRAVGDIGGRDAGRFLARAVGRPLQPPTDVVTVMGATVDLGGPTMLSSLPQAVSLTRETLLSELLGVAAVPTQREADRLEAQLAALEAAAVSERLEPMKRLIALLSDPRPIVRDRAAYALRMLTNMTYFIPWKDGEPAVLARGRRRWQMAYQRSKGAPRNAWLATGFLAAGYKVPELNQSRAWELVRAIAGPPRISYNAQRALMRLLKHAPPSLSWSKGAACMHWYKWVRGRRKSFKLEKPPSKVFRSCAGSP
jgi:hypothetical protein